jgi:hypothetical protein
MPILESSYCGELWQGQVNLKLSVGVGGTVDEAVNNSVVDSIEAVFLLMQPRWLRRRVPKWPLWGKLCVFSLRRG